MMQIPFVDLSRQYLNIKKDIDKAISKVLNKSSFILGEELTAFEKEFAEYCGVKYAIGVGSGTEALHLALIACGVHRGDRVITVPNTAVPTISAIKSANAKPILIDIDEDTYTMSPEKLEVYLKRHWTRKIKAVIPVHLYGHPADMDRILKIAKEYDLKLIEDACQAHGAEYKGKKAGSIGNTGCFSFYPTKNLGAYGDGGMVTTDDEEIAVKLRMLRNYGEEKKYYSLVDGFNSRLDELQAAILRKKMNYLSQWNEKRRKHAELYNALLIDTNVKTPVEKSYAKHVYHLYVIRTNKRDKLQQWLRSKGIASLIHYPLPVHFHPAYKDMNYSRGIFPISEKLSAEILSLAIFPELDDYQIEYICRAIKEFEKREFMVKEWI
jgi:dTDP-4-amino-4,6-dideoxygalactose transaminase